MNKRTRPTYFTGKPCPRGHIALRVDGHCVECMKICTRNYYFNNKEKFPAYGRKHDENNREKRKEKSRTWISKNREHMRRTVKEWRKQNPEKTKEQHKRFYLRHPEAYAAINAEREAMKRKAMPKWANHFFMREAYALAKLRTKTLGFKWSVDHIVPIKSKLVCGLHTDANLRVIPLIENSKKKNYYWPDMPD